MSALSLALSAALAALPFPALRLAVPTKDTKCDAGSVLLVDAARREDAKGEMKVTTAAGVVTFRIGPDAQVFDKDGKPAGAATGVAAGTRVRVYYVLDDGARSTLSSEALSPPGESPSGWSGQVVTIPGARCSARTP